MALVAPDLGDGMTPSPIITATSTTSAEWRFRRQHGNPDQDHALPQPGWYQVRLARGTVPTPLRFWTVQHRCRESGVLLADIEYHAELSGARVTADPPAGHDPGEIACMGLGALAAWSRHGLMAEAIEPEEYAFMVARARHAREHLPTSPHANPRQRTDWLHAPSPF